MASADPWHYSVRWALYHFRPSTQQHTELSQRPLRHTFAAAPGARVRVVMAGDLTDTPIASCSPSISRVFARADLVVGSYRADGVDADALRATMATLEVDPQRCVLALANDRAGDGGPDRLARTADALHHLDLSSVGTIANGELPLTTVEAGGLRLGVAAWTHWLDRDSFAEGQGVATPEQVLHHDWAAIKREHSLDSLLGSPHWEWPDQFVPRQDTVAIAQHLAESGFDVIGGHHPGIAQPMEWFATPDGHTNICQFSLGALGGRGQWPQRLGLLLEAELVADGEQRGRVASYQLHPVATIDSADGPRLVPLRYAPLALRQNMWQRIALLFDEARYPNKQPLQAASPL